jgi:hypothetical protein
MKRFFWVFIFTLLIAACKKEVSSVSIRVENQTAFDMNDVHVWTVNASFGNIKSGTVTAYKMFPVVPSDPSTDFIINGGKINRWYEFFTTPSDLIPGRYTLQITKDSLGYESRFVRE